MQHLSNWPAKGIFPAVSRRQRKLKRIARSAFFQRFPYEGRVALDTVDARGLVDFDLGVFFNRIPKTANSTVVVNLSKLKGEGDLTSREAKKSFPRPSTLQPGELGRFTQCFKFSFVRDPYTRTLSAYLYRIQKQERRYAGLNDAATDETAPSFLDFCRFLRTGGLYSDTHWAPQISLFLLPVEKFDFIGRFENLQPDLNTVLRTLRPDADLGTLSVFDDHRTDAAKKVADYYDSETRAIVGELYQSDFAAFGYKN